ncbi:type II toxin-antitoxin system MqsA family antitoxin [Delftia acidovorans]|uniref:type II toxin-antitoxin system MqsA family antitoxin n=1 Tax=Delftia acidovorans TaxID=80866 RepID=UPI00148293F3|nr:type II toxin-antitoxin system MqsA family antitoxin [Delftia acidovorans]
MKNSECEICGEEAVNETISTHIIAYNGLPLEVNIHSSVCSECGSEIVNQEQSLKNRRSVILKKKSVDGIPAGSKIKEMRIAANLTQAEAGKIVGGGPVAFSKYENDDLMPDAAMANILKVWEFDPTFIETLKKLNASAIRTAEVSKHIHFSSRFFSTDQISPSYKESTEGYSEEANEITSNFEFNKVNSYSSKPDNQWKYH